MSLTPSRVRIQASQFSTVLDFYTSLLNEWEILCKEQQEGKLKGISLVPANNAILPTAASNSQQQQGTSPTTAGEGCFIANQRSAASRYVDPNRKINNENHNHNNNNKSSSSSSTAATTAGGSGFSILGFELFLLGDGSSSSSSSSDSDDDEKKKEGDEHEKGEGNEQSTRRKKRSNNSSSALSPSPKMKPIVFSGFVSCFCKMSPWYGGSFEFFITMLPGHCCPDVQFAVPLSHPELRNGTQLSCVPELFMNVSRLKKESSSSSSSNSNSNSSVSLLGDILDAIRSLFVQPVSLFSNSIVARAVLDVRYGSVSSPLYDPASLAAAFSSSSSSSSSTTTATSKSTTKEQEAKAEELRYEAAKEEEILHNHSVINFGFSTSAPVVPAARLIQENREATEEMLSSDLSAIFCDAHNHFLQLLQQQKRKIISVGKRKEEEEKEQDEGEKEKKKKKKKKKKKSGKTMKRSSSLTSSQLQRDEDAKKAIRWVPKSQFQNVNTTSNFDAWTVRRLTVILKQLVTSEM